MSKKQITIIAISLVFGFIFGYFVFNRQSQTSKASAVGCPEKYTFINDSLDCEPKLVIKKHEYTQLQYEIEQFIEEGKKNNEFSHVSVFFRDFGGGPTLGINSDENFVPASLLKVPLMVTYFSIAENDKGILSKTASYSKVNTEVTQSIVDSDTIKPNTLYKVDELITRMIINSDNLAYGLLDKFLERLYPGENVYQSSLKQLGLVDPRNPAESTFSVKSYSSLFRQLYNSSYLSPEMSDRALKLLTETRFKDALVGGIPDSVIAAHKFGDREGLPGGEKQFHDCGIIYYPDNPYLLCIMTRGTIDDNLVGVIKDISEKVYKEVDSRRI